MQHTVGKISKQWSGLVREYFTAADNFGITFPMDLDVKMKACMIGALFLIVSCYDTTGHGLELPYASFFKIKF